MRPWLQRLWRALVAPRMLYGFRRADGRWLAHTRISTACHLEAPEKLDIGDHVYIGHHCVVDASGGLTLGEGVQVTSHCALLTHSSHRALRLAGRAYWGAANPPGFVRAATTIGDWTFIGAMSVVAPGSRIGRGVLVRAHSYVRGEVPDFAIVAGRPATVVGDTRATDAAWLAEHPEDIAAYETWAGAGWRAFAPPSPPR